MAGHLLVNRCPRVSIELTIAPSTNPRVTADPELRPLDEVLSTADLLVIGAPQPEYRCLATDKPVADIWNVLGQGVRV